MSWWKKILSVIPLIFAGYEVGKTIEESDNKEIIKAIREGRVHEIDSGEKPESILHIIAITAVVLIIIFLVIRKIQSSIRRNLQRIANERQHI